MIIFNVNEKRSFKRVIPNIIFLLSFFLIVLFVFIVARDGNFCEWFKSLFANFIEYKSINDFMLICIIVIAVLFSFNQIFVFLREWVVFLLTPDLFSVELKRDCVIFNQTAFLGKNISNYDNFKSVEMDIETELVKGFKGTSSNLEVKSVTLWFTLRTGKKLKIEYFPLFFKNLFIVNVLKFMTLFPEFSYKFIGSGKMTLLDEKINFYKVAGYFPLVSPDNIGVLKFFSLVSFLMALLVYSSLKSLGPWHIAYIFPIILIIVSFILDFILIKEERALKKIGGVCE